MARRNRFDCIVVLLSWLLYVYALFESGSTSNLARSARIIRLARPISLIRKSRSARLRKVGGHSRLSKEGWTARMGLCSERWLTGLSHGLATGWPCDKQWPRRRRICSKVG